MGIGAVGWGANERRASAGADRSPRAAIRNPSPKLPFATTAANGRDPGKETFAVFGVGWHPADPLGDLGLCQAAQPEAEGGRTKRSCWRSDARLRQGWPPAARAARASSEYRRWKWPPPYDAAYAASELMPARRNPS